ncbi:MAG: hypothetical protein JNM25_14475 [Planctomycetes bacterium]|nr:hypothetical protein [Planctomycetota bacterium]
MSTTRRLPTAVCLLAATLVALLGTWGAWEKYHWLTTWLDGVVLASAVIALLLQPLAWRRLGRAAPPPGPVLRVAFVAAVGLWLAYAIVAGGYVSHRVACVGIAWGAVAAAAVWLGPRAPRRPGRPGLLLLAVATLLAVAEGSLRTLAWLTPGPLWASRTAHSAERLRVHAFAPGERHYDFPINAHGCCDEPFAAPSPTRGPVVAVVGDSFSAGVVPHALHYTTVAEHEPGVSTIWNVGWPALGPPEYRNLIERIVLPLRADAAIVSLFLGNDLPETPPWDGVDQLLGSWFDRGNVLLLEVPRRVWRHLRGTGEDVGLKQLGDLAAAQVWLHDPMREPGSFTAAAYLALETDRAVNACDPTHPSLPAMLAELRRMHALCQDRPFGYVLIPDEFMVEDGLWQRIVAAWPADRPVGERWMLRDRLVAFCRDEGIPCLDLLPILRAVPPLADGDRHLYLLRDTHWNVRGNAVAGAALATFVRELRAGRGR